MMTMRIVQLVVDGAGYYEKKSASIDAAILESQSVESWRWEHGDFRRNGARAGRAAFLRTANAADVVHLYAPREIPVAAARGLRVPYIAEGSPAKSHWPWEKAPLPAVAL